MPAQPPLLGLVGPKNHSPDELMTSVNSKPSKSPNRVPFDILASAICNGRLEDRILSKHIWDTIILSDGPNYQVNLGQETEVPDSGWEVSSISGYPIIITPSEISPTTRSSGTAPSESSESSAKGRYLMQPLRPVIHRFLNNQFRPSRDFQG